MSDEDDFVTKQRKCQHLRAERGWLNYHVRSEDYECPDCHARFSGKDMQVVLLQKLIAALTKP